MNDHDKHTAMARTPWRTKWSTAARTSSSCKGIITLPKQSTRSRTPTRSAFGTRSGGRFARVRSICTSSGMPSAHERDRATWIVSSWPAVAIRPTRGPTPLDQGVRADRRRILHIRPRPSDRVVARQTQLGRGDPGGCHEPIGEVGVSRQRLTGRCDAIDHDVRIGERAADVYVDEVGLCRGHRLWVTSGHVIAHRGPARCHE